tara:strand:+ start:42 stop:644 length:603 start_codon:yes stop_codon:yes gene_type:complete
MDNLKNAWRDSDTIFHKQLKLNLKEISSVENYPQHWHVFIDYINNFNPRSILDIGCGCGTYYELCRKHLNIKYTGIDYSKYAVQLAKETWDCDSFMVKDYTELTYDYIQKFDLVHAGAMFDVLPNGDEALEFVMSLKPRALLIGRMKLTDKDSYYNTYTAYDSITTCEFYHNKNHLLDLCLTYNYDVYQVLNNFYLRMKE